MSIYSGEDLSSTIVTDTSKRMGSSEDTGSSSYKASKNSREKMYSREQDESHADGPQKGTRELQCLISPSLMGSLEHWHRTNDVCAASVTYYLKSVAAMDESGIRVIVAYLRNPELTNRQVASRVRGSIPELPNNEHIKLRYSLTEFIMNTIDPTTGRKTLKVDFAGTPLKEETVKEDEATKRKTSKTKKLSRVSSHDVAHRSSSKGRAGSPKHTEAGSGRALHGRKTSHEQMASHGTGVYTHDKQASPTTAGKKESPGVPTGVSPAAQKTRPKSKPRSREEEDEEEDERDEESEVDEVVEGSTTRLVQMGSLAMRVKKKDLDEIEVEARRGQSSISHALKLKADTHEVAEGVALLKTLLDMDMKEILELQAQWEEDDADDKYGGLSRTGSSERASSRGLHGVGSSERAGSRGLHGVGSSERAGSRGLHGVGSSERAGSRGLHGVGSSERAGSRGLRGFKSGESLLGEGEDGLDSTSESSRSSRKGGSKSMKGKGGESGASSRRSSRQSRSSGSGEDDESSRRSSQRGSERRTGLFLEGEEKDDELDGDGASGSRKGSRRSRKRTVEYMTVDLSDPFADRPPTPIAGDQQAAAKSYFDSKGISMLFETLLCRLLLDQPTRPLDYLIELTGQMNVAYLKELAMEEEEDEHSCSVCASGQSKAVSVTTIKNSSWTSPPSMGNLPPVDD